MSRQYIEGTSPTVSGSSCSYATLSHYNNGSKGMQPPVPRETVSGSYVVPSYSAPGYNTLNHGATPSCSGFFNIGDAYKSNGGNCNTKFVKKLCQ